MDTPEHCRDSAGAVRSPHTLIKTHAWSSEWDPGTASHIFLTHRDLRGVLASYQRVGWAFDITLSYVQEHMRWRVRRNPHAAAVKYPCGLHQRGILHKSFAYSPLLITPLIDWPAAAVY